MRRIALLSAFALAACATDPTHGLSNAQLREMSQDAGPRPVTATAAPMLEAAVKARLKDPDSARFEWPNDFRDGGYRPLGGAHIDGWATCGAVNAKNGFGGYAGKSAVVVVVNQGSVVYVGIGGGPYDTIAYQCAKAGMPVL